MKSKVLLDSNVIIAASVYANLKEYDSPFKHDFFDHATLLIGIIKKNIGKRIGIVTSTIESEVHRTLSKAVNATLKQFQKEMKQLADSQYRIRISPEQEIIKEPLMVLDGTWIGPPRRKHGTCLYYKRKRDDWLSTLAALSTHGFAGVVGNDCWWTDRYRLMGDNVNNVHKEPLIIDDTAILGLEGSPLDIGYILYEEDEARIHLESHYEKTKNVERKILVTHAPPKRVLDLSRRFAIHHIGSAAVREFIEERDIDLVICGHSHINGGKYEKVGDCHVLNIASHDYYGAPGRVALIELGSKGECSISTDLLFDSDSALRQLHKLGRKRIEALREMGIDSLDQITEENRNLIQSLQGVGSTLCTKWITEVGFLREERAVRISDPVWKRINLKKCLVYDIETNTTQTRVWSIGVYTSDDEVYTQFHDKDDEKKLLEDFFNFVRCHEHLLPYTFSATDFDLRVITFSAKNHNVKIPKVLQNGIDIGWLTSHRTLGIPKGGLKAIAVYFGSEWTDKSMDGMQAGMLYSRYLETGEEADWEKLLQYNKDDVMATYHLLVNLMELDEISLQVGK